jgi:hypothetical protein
MPGGKNTTVPRRINCTSAAEAGSFCQLCRRPEGLLHPVIGNNLGWVERPEGMLHAANGNNLGWVERTKGPPFHRFVLKPH